MHVFLGVTLIVEAHPGDAEYRILQQPLAFFWYMKDRDAVI